MLKKTVIIINGKGGSGKDTFCDIVTDYKTSEKPTPLGVGWIAQKK